MKPFFNMLDKGHRATQHVLQNQQKIIQPKFSKDKNNFTGLEALCISEVASDRSGNERAVRCVKRSGCLAGGIKQNQSFDRVNDVWKAFGFQINFMHKPVV